MRYSHYRESRCPHIRLSHNWPTMSHKRMYFVILLHNPWQTTVNPWTPVVTLVWALSSGDALCMGSSRVDILSVCRFGEFHNPHVGAHHHFFRWGMRIHHTSDRLWYIFRLNIFGRGERGPVSYTLDGLPIVWWYSSAPCISCMAFHSGPLLQHRTPIVLSW